MARRREYRLGPCSTCKRVVLKKSAYCRRCANERAKANLKKRSKTRQFCLSCRVWFFPTNAAVYAHRRRDTHGGFRKPLNWYCSVACMLKAKTKHGPQAEKERLRKRRYRDRLKAQKELGASLGRCLDAGSSSTPQTPVVETRTVQVPRS